jgi:hypothetical protein
MARQLGRLLETTFLALLMLSLSSHVVGQLGPPRGWNSYMSTGGAVDEATLLDVADYVSENLLPSGFNLLVSTEGLLRIISLLPSLHRPICTPFTRRPPPDSPRSRRFWTKAGQSAKGAY